MGSNFNERAYIMSGRKDSLQKFQTITNGDMSGNLTSAVSGIQYSDNISIAFVFTGTPTGTFGAQVSNDYNQDSQGNVTSVGNWINLPITPTLSASGSAGVAGADLNQLGWPWIRFIYTASSGSGTLNAFVAGKMI